MKRFLTFAFTALVFLAPASQALAQSGNTGAPDGNTGVSTEGNVGIPSKVESSLPNLGDSYVEKLRKLKESIGKAIEVFKKKREASADARGKEIKGEEYFLRKIEKAVETNADHSLKDPNGFLKLFYSIKLLDGSPGSVSSDVIQNAKDLQTFSYLFPPKTGKPLLVMVPGAGGEPLYASAATLYEKAKDFNIVVYPYDSNVAIDEAAVKFKNEFIASNVHARKHLIVPYSMGNNVLFSAMQKALIEGNTGLFSNSHVVSIAFVPGGSATQQRLPLPVQSITKVILPYYYKIIQTFNPRNPEHAVRAQYLQNVRLATAGKEIVFIEANGDIHLNRTSTVREYAPGRDATLRSMGEVGGNIIFVDPSSSNKHAGIWDTSEVKNEIDSYLRFLVPPKPKATAQRFLTMESPFLFVKTMSSLIAALAATGQESAPRLFDMLGALLPGPVPSECSLLSEVLADTMILRGATYATTANAIKDYILETRSSCSFDEVEKNARAMLEAEGFVVPDGPFPPATSPQPPTPPNDNLGVSAESVFDTVSLDLKVNGKDGPVTVSPGSRIVVSWISEGATRCRANWSRNDIKLASTAAGRLSRSITIRAACINAEGERVDDAVQVLVDPTSS